MNYGMKMFHMSALMMATGLLIAIIANASAQQVRNCGPRPQVVKHLTTNYGETRQSIGLGANNSLIEVYASPQHRDLDYHNDPRRQIDLFNRIGTIL